MSGKKTTKKCPVCKGTSMVRKYWTELRDTKVPLCANTRILSKTHEFYKDVRCRNCGGKGRIRKGL